MGKQRAKRGMIEAVLGLHDQINRFVCPIKMQGTVGEDRYTFVASPKATNKQVKAAQRILKSTGIDFYQDG